MAGYDKRRINTHAENLIAYRLEYSPRFAGYGSVLIEEFHHNDCLVVKRESKGGILQTALEVKRRTKSANKVPSFIKHYHLRLLRR